MYDSHAGFAFVVVSKVYAAVRDDRMHLGCPRLGGVRHNMRYDGAQVMYEPFQKAMAFAGWVLHVPSQFVNSKQYVRACAIGQISEFAKMVGSA